MSDQPIKLKNKHAITPSFRKAIVALSEQTSLPMKERYAVARTIKDIDAALGTYYDLRYKLVAEYGELQLAIRERRLAALEQATPLDKPLVEAMRAEIEQLKLADKKSPPMEVDEQATDPARYAEFKKKWDELLEVEFPVYLSHRVKLDDKATLNATDLLPLLDLVEV